MFGGGARIAVVLAAFIQQPAYPPSCAAANSPQRTFAEIGQINVEAAAARSENKLESVDLLRRERWQAVAAEARRNPESRDIWVRAFLAIQQVDGDPFIETEQGKPARPGLINECRYKEAYDLLSEIWRECEHESQKVVIPGEVAVRIFECVNQAKGILQGVSDSTSPDFLATDEDLAAMLKIAAKSDPCCIQAVPMKAFVTRTDPAEAYLRVDVRPDFKARQAELAKLSHPVFVVLQGSEKDKGTKNGDVPVAAWHAPTELAKAQSLQLVLKDLDYALPLTPDIPVPGALENYMVPGHMISCTDALGDPVQFVHGRMLLSSTLDRISRRRSAFLYVDETGAWRKRYLNVLWQRPGEEAAEKDPAATLLASFPELRRFSLGPQEYSLLDFPILKTEEFIRLGVQLFNVKDVFRFTDTTYKPTGNSTKHLSSHRSHPKIESESPTKTSPPVVQAVSDIETNNDSTKHTINELLSKPGLNPLLIVSEDDGTSCEPAWRSDGDGPRFLLLDDGRKLRFEVAADNPANAYFELQEDGVVTRFPLGIEAIPDALIAATPIGSLMLDMLRESGYGTTKECHHEIRKVFHSIQNGDQYFPPLFQKQLNSRAKSTKADKLTASLEMMAESIIRRMGPADHEKFRQELAPFLTPEKRRGGDTLRWCDAFVKSRTPWPEELFVRYGFRHVIDPRGNIVSHRGLTSAPEEIAAQPAPPPGASGPSSPQQSQDAFDYPFDFRTPDGEKRISTSQIYGWSDYQQIKTNIYREHLSKAMALHPCYPLLAWVKADAAKEIENPSARDPQYVQKTTQDQPTPAGNVPANTIDGGAFPLLTAACTIEEAFGDPDMLTSVNFLLQAYAEIWFGNTAATYRGESARQDRLRLIFLRDIGVGRDPKLREWLAKQLDEASKAAGDRPQFSTLNAIQISAARSLAKLKYHHKSIIFYNDVISTLTASADTSVFDLFQKVGTTDEAEAFISKVESLISLQRQILNLELELGGVMTATRYSESGYQVWKRIVDEYRCFIEPSTRLAADYIQAYGLRLSDRLTQAIAQIESVVRTAEEAIRRYELSCAWRSPALAKGHDDDAIQQAIDDLPSLLAAKNPTTDSEGKLDRALMATRNPSLSIPKWLAVKQAMLAQPHLAFRGDYNVHPLQYCPASYDETYGLSRNLAGILEKTSAEDMIRFCRSVDEPSASAESANIAFLIGWYWLDQRDAAKAREAFMFAASAFSSAAANEPDRHSALVLELSGYQMLLGASSAFVYLPGLIQQKTSFSQGLVAQLLNWERRWFAAGLIGPHATTQVMRLREQFQRLATQIERTNTDWRASRYFFPDYTFRLKALPDIVVMKLLEERESVKKKLDEEGKEVAAQGQAAVQGDAWALKDKESALKFLDKFQGIRDFDDSIVFLKQR